MGGPRLQQIDERNHLGIDTEGKADLLHLPVKTVPEYEYRVRLEAEVARCEREIEACRAAGSDPRLSAVGKVGAMQGEVDWMVAKQMAEERLERWELQMAGSKLRGYEETERYIALNHIVGRDLEGLRAWQDHYGSRASSQGVCTFDESDARVSALSADDYRDACVRGGAKAAREWYFEQKEQLHFGRKYMSEDTRDLDQVLASRRAELVKETAEVVTFSAVETNAALNYWRGRAEEFNATREAVVKAHPGLQKDLPPALEVDEIRVRQVTMDRDQKQGHALAIAR